MSVAILVATPYAAFGELLRISLEDNGQYQVRLVSSGNEALLCAGRNSYQLTILDAAISDIPFIQLCKSILDSQKGIRLVIIPPDNNPSHSSLGDLLPHGYISRPFYLPDLVETISRLINERDVEVNSRGPFSATLPFWLHDQEVMQSYLERELPNTQAIHGVIIEQQNESTKGTLKASAGRLSEAAIKELTAIVLRFWNCDEKTDLMRFIRLEADKQDYLVYATRMIGDLTLILVFGPSSPLSQIRPQTKSLAQVIATFPPRPEDDQVQSKQDSLPTTMEEPAGEVISEDGISSSSPSTGSVSEQSMENFDIFSRVQSGFNPSNSYQVDDESEHLPDVADTAFDIQVPDITAILGPIPTPDPSPPEEWIDTSPLTPSDHEISGPEAVVTQTAQTVDHESQVSSIQNSTNPPEDENLVAETSTNGSKLIFSELVPEPDIDPLEDTRPHVVTTINSLSQLEPVSPAMSQLKYTCILIPRIPHHYLTGSLSDQVGQWIQQVCLAYGWRLEGLSIRPEYLQWTVQVAPSISPGNVVRIIRQRSSFQIFNKILQYRDENPSGDFWAAGYLIVSGAQPPSSQLLREFIDQTRRRQGF